MNDTIAAIATGLGEAGIGIVRLSGKGALKIADKVFLAKDGGKPSRFKTYTLHYGWIIDKKLTTYDLRPSIVDEVLLTVMRAPRSYTKEDVAEINCHGGLLACRRVLELVFQNGCRLAEPGEFTKRAFLNGRIDLTQAEAVLDIIRAKSEAALQMGAAQLKGGLSAEVEKIRNGLIAALAQIEAEIDFPEEGQPPAEPGKAAGYLEAAGRRLKSLLDSARRGRILREGVHAVICGRPNVGKSSLLNALLRCERSIVTAVPGTTRDTIEEIIDIKGVPLRIVDTAGILEPRDLVEKKAVQRAREEIRLADLVLLMFDASRQLCAQDKKLIRGLRGKRALAIVNKIDLRRKIDMDYLRAQFPRHIEISLKRDRNLEALEGEIFALAAHGQAGSACSQTAVSLRHLRLLRQAQKGLAACRDSLDNRLALELAAEGLKQALSALDEISGKGFSADLLERIFSEFCVGK